MGARKARVVNFEKKTNKLPNQWQSRTDLSTQSKRLDDGLLAGASCPPTAYRKPLHVATPTPPRRLLIGAHSDHLLVCGSKHSTERRHELPSRPPTAYSLSTNQSAQDIILANHSAGDMMLANQSVHYMK